MDEFWAEIEGQLALLKLARSADAVIRFLDSSAVADAFFAGGGGDGSVYESLWEAGWEVVWFEAGYYWCMSAPDGSAITYVEGDVYRGDSRSATDNG